MTTLHIPHPSDFSPEDYATLERVAKRMGQKPEALYVSFNTIAHGMRLEPPFADMKAADVAPGGRFEHLLPGGRPASGAPASTPARRPPRTTGMAPQRGTGRRR